MPKEKDSSFCDHIYTSISKYNFQISDYLLPLASAAPQEKPRVIPTISSPSIPAFLPKEEAQEEVIEETIEKAVKLEKHASDLEAFKSKKCPIVPEVFIWSFMTETEVEEVKKATDIQKLHVIVENKLGKLLPRGPSRKLLKELILSIMKFCRKYDYNLEQTGGLLSIFYNTHLYFLHNLWTTAEEVYNYFKTSVYFHSIKLPPYRVKIYTVEDCNKFTLLFCYLYIRNLPLIRFLMLPNYGLLFKIKNQLSEEEQKFIAKVQGKGKKGKK